MTRPLYTEADLYLPDAKPLRLSQIMEITGYSRNTLRAEMESGRLVGFRNLNRPGSYWAFRRPVVLAWWLSKQRNSIAC